MVSRAISLADQTLRLFEEWTLFITVMAALIGLFLCVVLRYMFSYCLPWPEELVREVIQYSTFVGAAAAIRAGGTLKIDVLPAFFPVLNKPLGLFSDLAVLCFSVYITIVGWQAAMNITGQSTVILEIPYPLLYMMIPLMGVLMFLRTLIVLGSHLVKSERDREACRD